MEAFQLVGERHDAYIEYTLLYDMIANRITIAEVRAENGCLRLMKNLILDEYVAFFEMVVIKESLGLGRGLDVYFERRQRS